MFLDKRGISDVVFKWVFGIVAGSLILIFLIRFAYQHIDLSEKLNIREIIESLDDHLEGFSISESSSKVIPLNRDLELKFFCDSFGGGDYLKRTNKIIFSSKFFKGNSLSAWTEKWRFPFDVVNFYYLANKNVRYLLIYDDRSGNFVRDKLEFPLIFNLQKMHFRDFNINKVRLESSNLDQLNLIFFRDIDNMQNIRSSLKIDVNIVEINLDINEAKINGKETFYLEKEMLEGLIIGPEDYECLLDKALAKLSLVSEIYLQKSRMLRLKTRDQSCDALYAQISLNLERLKISKVKEELINIKDISEEQNRMLGRNGCVEIF